MRLEPPGASRCLSGMRISAALFIIVVSIWPAIAHGQQDSAATLRIQFAAAGSVFQTGEIIPVDLLFSAAGDGYQMGTRNYDRSGRLNLEQFRVSPPGRDPLHDHYQGGIYGGFIGGGASSVDESLSADPETIREDLNEWVAPDKPGYYSLYVTSSRVSRRDGAKLENLTLRSDPLEFDAVEASAAWQAQTLGAAAATLRNAGSTLEEKHAAARTLRFLDTPDSVRELARELATSSDENHWDFVAGILGSRHRQEAEAELEAQLAAPDAAITAEFLSALAEIKFLLDREPMPRYPEQDKRQQAAWSAHQGTRVKQFEQLQDELYAQAAALAGSKHGSVRAETVRTLSVEGKTVLPVATVRYGFGGSSGGKGNNWQHGGGGGGGLVAKPLGVVEITQSQTRFIPIFSSRALVIAVGVGVCLGSLVASRN